MAGRLDGKKCFITAAAQGIGRACALAFAREGAKVTATDVNAAKLAELDGTPGIATRRLDVLDKTAIEGCAREVGAIGVLLNCAGFVHHGSILDCDDEAWEFSNRLNVRAPFWVTRVFLPAMLAAGGGDALIERGRLHRARADRVAADALLDVVGGDRLGHADHGRLGRAVDEAVGHALH